MHERHAHLCQRQNSEFENESHSGVSERCFYVLVSEAVKFRNKTDVAF